MFAIHALEQNAGSSYEFKTTVRISEPYNNPINVLMAWQCPDTWTRDINFQILSNRPGEINLVNRIIDLSRKYIFSLENAQRMGLVTLAFSIGAAATLCFNPAIALKVAVIAMTFFCITATEFVRSYKFYNKSNQETLEFLRLRPEYIDNFNDDSAKLVFYTKTKDMTRLIACIRSFDSDDARLRLRNFYLERSYSKYIHAHFPNISQRLADNFFFHLLTRNLSNQELIDHNPAFGVFFS